MYDVELTLVQDGREIVKYFDGFPRLHDADVFVANLRSVVSELGAVIGHYRITLR